MRPSLILPQNASRSWSYVTPYQAQVVCSVRSFFSLRSILKTVVKFDEQSCQLLSANSEVNFLHFQSFAQVLFQFPLAQLLYLGETGNSSYGMKKYGGGGKQDIFGNNVFS